AASRPAPGKHLFRRVAPSDGDRPARTGRSLFRHQYRHSVRQSRRGRKLELHRATPARDPLRGDPGGRDVGGPPGSIMPKENAPFVSPPVVVTLPAVLINLFPGSVGRVELS